MVNSETQDGDPGVQLVNGVPVSAPVAAVITMPDGSASPAGGLGGE
jgi:hypothetical protein